MPAMRSKVEMIKDVKTGKGVVLAVGDVAQLVERCEVKEGDEIDEEGDGHGWGGIRRLQVHRRKMQEMVVECELALIVMIHAHISLKDVLAAVKTKSGECAAVILPCCNWYSRLAHPDGATAPCHEYEDDAVVSPQRTVRVFSSLPCGISGAGDGVPCPEVV